MHNKISGIYIIRNIINNKVYIGSSVSINSRLSTHKNLLMNNKHFNKHLQSSYNKYGLNSFTFNILEITNVSIINEREEFNISLYNANDTKHGYNKRIKCDTNIGKKFSSQHIENLRKSHIGIKRSKEAHRKIIESQYKEVYKIDESGKILEKYKSLIDAGLNNDIHKESISACCSNKLNSTGGYFWCFANNYTKEQFMNRNIGDSKKFTSYTYKNTLTGEIFNKLTEAARSIGLKSTTLSAMLNGQNKNKTNIIRY